MQIVETLTGTRAETCPWWSFHDPLVADVITCHPFFESGQLEFIAGRNPPAVLVSAIALYQSALARVASYQRREKESQRGHDAQHAAAVRQMGSLYRG